MVLGEVYLRPVLDTPSNVPTGKRPEGVNEGLKKEYF